MKKGFSFLLIAFGLLFSSCNKENEKPENLIEENVYLSVMVEIQILDALIYTTDNPPNPDSLLTEIYKKYNITEDAFSASHLFYQSNIEDHIVRIDSALKVITSEKDLFDQSESEN